MKKQPKIETDILFFAFRYALGRRTGAVTFMVTEISNRWPLIDVVTQNQIQREIKDAISMDRAGDKCDIDSWRKILYLAPDDAESVIL